MRSRPARIGWLRYLSLSLLLLHQTIYGTDTCLPSVPEELWLHSSASGRWEPDGMMFSLFLDILTVRNL